MNEKLLKNAIDRRRDSFGRSLQRTDCFRLVHGAHDHLPGWTIDVLGEVANIRVLPACGSVDSVERCVAFLHESTFPPVASAWVTLDEARKDNARANAEQEAACNDALRKRGLFPEREEWIVRENDVHFLIRRDSGFSYGLFLDMRDVRRDLAARWRGRRVLNLFAYTCGFGAALGSENEVWNVDVSQPYLDWGKRNHELNGNEANARFYRKDAFEFLEFAVERGFTYDAIILDPPVFSHGKSGLSRRFQIGEDLEQLVELACRTLTEDGECFVSTNYAAMTAAEFNVRVQETVHAHGRSVERQWPAPPDFPVNANEYHLKTALIR